MTTTTTTTASDTTAKRAKAPTVSERVYSLLGLDPTNVAHEAVLYQRLWNIGAIPDCERCGGTGYLPYAAYGGVCFKCNAKRYHGVRLTKAILAAAEQAIAEGKLEAYFARNRNSKAIGKASDRVLAAWGTTSVSLAYGSERLHVTSEQFGALPVYTLNMRMSAAYQRVSRQQGEVTATLRRLDPRSEQASALVSGLAELVSWALAEIEAAELEFLAIDQPDGAALFADERVELPEFLTSVAQTVEANTRRVPNFEGPDSELVATVKRTDHLWGNDKHMEVVVTRHGGRLVAFTRLVSYSGPAGQKRDSDALSVKAATERRLEALAESGQTLAQTAPQAPVAAPVAPVSAKDFTLAAVAYPDGSWEFSIRRGLRYLTGVGETETHASYDEAIAAGKRALAAHLARLNGSTTGPAGAQEAQQTPAGDGDTQMAPAEPPRGSQEHETPTTPSQEDPSCPCVPTPAPAVEERSTSTSPSLAAGPTAPAAGTPAPDPTNAGSSLAATGPRPEPRPPRLSLELRRLIADRLVPAAGFYTYLVLGTPGMGYSRLASAQITLRKLRLWAEGVGAEVTVLAETRENIRVEITDPAAQQIDAILMEQA